MVRPAASGTKRKTTIARIGAAEDNEGMNLFLALFWLLCAIGLLTFEQSIGPTAFHKQMGFSEGWLMLAFAAYNVVRWWSRRAYGDKQRAQPIRKGGLRRRASEPAEPPDPNFNFSDESPPEK
jgi:hypothetical protein